MNLYQSEIIRMAMKKAAKMFVCISVLLSVSLNAFGQKNVEFAESILKDKNIPQISYAVVNADSVLEIAAIGRHSVNLEDRATLDDRFHIASNTKAMTAFVIAKFVESGKLNWETKFFDLFPDWKKNSNPAYYEITLQELLAHRAKIQPFQGEEEKVPEFTGSNQQKRRKFGKYVLTLPPVSPATTAKFTYSNGGYVLAALMLEKKIGKTWEKLIQKVFNQDLKIDVKLSFPENLKKKDTWGHITENNKLIPVSSKNADKLDFTAPAGDLNIKLADFIKFVQLNLKGLKGEDNYLKAATYRFMHERFEDYSIGWYNGIENGKNFSTHAGTVGTYYTIASLDRKNLVGYIIFTNSFNEETVSGVRLLMRKLKETYGG